MASEAVNVDDALFEVLEIFSEAADKVNAPWLMIGATARILLLEKIYGWPQGLGTQDVDFAVQVGGWEHYHLLCDKIISNKILETDRAPTKRFHSKQAMVFDLVPYSGVENSNKQVFWPPDNDDVMTVRGFGEAAKDAVNIRINDKLSVPIVSPRGLCALKLFAWEERHVQHPGRDAKDIGYLFKNIELLYTAKTLHEEYPDSINAANYVIESAGHFQLGYDVSDLLHEDDHEFLANFLERELSKKDDSVLCREIYKNSKMKSVEVAGEALSYFYKGFCEMA